MAELTQYERLEQRCRDAEENLHDKIELVRQKIDGNGGEGMNTRLALIEQTLVYMKEAEQRRVKKEQMRSTREWSVLLMVLALVGRQVFIWATGL